MDNLQSLYNARCEHVFRNIGSDREIMPVDESSYIECFRANKFDKYDCSEEYPMPTAEEVIDFVTGLRQTRAQLKMT